MKNIFACLAICFLAANVLYGQETNQRHLEVRVMLPDLVSALNIGLEYIPNARFGAEVSTGFRTAESYIFSSFDNDGGETDFYAIIKGKYYLKPRHGADRIYVGPYGLYEHDKDFALFDQKKYENRMIIGGLLGYKLLLFQKASLDFVAGSGFGRQLNKSKFITGTRVFSQDKLNFHVLVNLNLGWRF